MTGPAGETALWEAVREGDAERLAALLDGGAGPDARTPEGIPLTRAAVYHGRPALAEVLLERGAPLDGFTAAALGRESDVAAMLDDGRLSAGARSEDGWTALHLAAFFGRAGVARALLDRGADHRARSTNDLANTPLHAAAAGGHLAVVRILVERGADVNAEAGGIAPLDIACGRGDDEMARYLVEHGAKKARRNGG